MVIDMKKYHMIDKTERNTREELKMWTLEELKAYFTIDDEDFSNADKMDKVQDIDDLENLLREEADGMEVHYEFEEVEGESNIKMWRKNAMLSQQKMAAVMEIPKRTIENWESGERKAPAYVERLVIKELKEITEKTIEAKMQKEMNKMPSDEEGNRPVGSWAIITTNGNDEFVELYETMNAAVNDYVGEGYVGYIACNMNNMVKEPWYTDKNGNVYPDHESIEL